MLVIWVVALVGLLAMTALAIDLGNIAQTKEHAETAVQDAALSAVPDLSSLCALCGGTASTQVARAATQETQAVTHAEAYLVDNYSSVTNSQFNNCANLLPSTIYVWPSEDCFGFFDPADPTNTSNMNQYYATGLAVALPTQEVKYSVGQGAGLKQQPVSAVAYASLKSADNGYGMPFAYAAGGGSGGQCLATAGGQSTPSCNSGFATGPGNFGLINSPRYQFFQLGGAYNGVGNNPVVETDLVLGIDHPLSAYLAPNIEYCDGYPTITSCGGNYNDTPNLIDSGNAVNVDTGTTDATVGLFQGGVTTPDNSCTLAPRLNHVNGFIAGPTCSADDPAGAGNTLSGTEPLLSATYGDTFGSAYQLNGASIDQYLSGTNPDGRQAINTCPLSNGVSASTTAIDNPGWASFNLCLSTFIQTYWPTANSSVTDSDSNWIFSSSIEQSPRFGLVPLITSATGTGAQEIVSFAAAYLDLGYAKGNPNKVGAIGAWVFPLDLIQNASTAGFGQSDYTGGPYTATLCSLTSGSC